MSTKPSKRGPGRPSFEATERDRTQVRMLAAMGVPDYEICKLVGISEPTLRKHFYDELDVGHIEANARVAQSLFKMATNPDHPKAVSAAIFWLKARAGWREGSAPEDEGKKAAREGMARTAHQGTAWEGLLQ